MGQKTPQNLKKKTALVLFKEIWDLDTFSFGRVFSSPLANLVSQNVKMGARSPPNGNPEKPKRAGGRGRRP